MSTLEEAVNTLAGALDSLEANLNARLAELAAQQDFSDAARRHARTARRSTGDASDALATAIAEIKSILEDANLQEGA